MKQNSNGTSTPNRLLVISDQSGFSRDLVARWQMQPHVPEFTALRSDLLRGNASTPFDLVIAGDLHPERGSEVLTHLNRGTVPAVYLAAPGESPHSLRRERPRVTVVPRHDAWLDTLVLLAEEMLKRIEISGYVDRLQQNARIDYKHATLGKYMVESRHGFNNALTSVLGNAELLLLESSLLNAGMREQLETLHSMSLRLHEMMQRFTSLEMELQCAEKPSHTEKGNTAAYVARG